MLAIYEFFGVERKIPEIYNGLLDPKVGLKALEAVFH
jgi:oleate hydratase